MRVFKACFRVGTEVMEGDVLAASLLSAHERLASIWGSTLEVVSLELESEAVHTIH